MRARGGRRLTDRAEAVALLESGGGGEAGKPPADPQKDAVARSRAGGGGGEGEARGARRCWRRRWRGRRRSRNGGERVTASKTPARAVRSPFCLTCLRTAPTGGEEGGEPAGTVCARSPRAGGRQLTERGARSRSESGCPVPQIAKSNKKNSWVLVDNKPCSGRHQRAGRRRSCCASKSRRPSSRIVSSSCALTDGSARLLAGSAITVDGRQEDQRCAARRQTTTLAPARRGFLAARQMVSGRRWRHGRDELRGRHVAMRPSY